MGALELKIISLELKIDALQLNVEISASDVFTFHIKVLNFDDDMREIYSDKTKSGDDCAGMVKYTY